MLRSLCADALRYASSQRAEYVKPCDTLARRAIYRGHESISTDLE